METGYLVMNILMGSVGLGLFLYGKKRSQFGKLIIGIAFMVLPFLLTEVTLLMISSILLLILAWYWRE